MGKLIIPENYRSCLSSYETQEAIGMIKNPDAEEIMYGVKAETCDRTVVC